jgi:hypothetical protein
VLDHDFMPFGLKEKEAWSGYYTSRPAMKKSVKDYSMLFHAANNFFSKEMIKHSTTEKQIKEIQTTLNDMADTLGVVNHHDAITGTEAEYVLEDYKYIMYN